MNVAGDGNAKSATCTTCRYEVIIANRLRYKSTNYVLTHNHGAHKLHVYGVNNTETHLLFISVRMDEAKIMCKLVAGMTGFAR